MEPSEDIFRLLTATYTRRLLQALEDPCLLAEDASSCDATGPEIVLSAAVARICGRSLLYGADDVIAEPDWLILCETRQERGGEGALFGFAQRLPGQAGPSAFVASAVSIILAQPADPSRRDHYAGAIAAGDMTKAEFLAHLLSSPEALARRWRFALLPLDGELSAVFGSEGFDDLHPPRFVVED